MKNRKRLIFIIQALLLYCFSTVLVAQNTTEDPVILSPAFTSQLENSIEQIQISTRTPGISIGLVHKGSDAKMNSWQYQSGFADIENQTKLGPQHIFRTGSVSKVLLATAIMQLIEQQQLSLQSKVKDVLPQLSFNNPWQDSHPLLVAHLLNHSSGWDAPHFAANIPQSGNPITILDALALRPETRKSRWPPGTRTAYNNTGCLVLAAIVEHISNTSFEAYVKQHIFTPLGMHASDYFFTDHYAQNAVSHYKGTLKIPYIHINNRASGALNSHSGDLLKLVTMMLSSEETVLSTASKRLMLSPSFSHYSAEGISIGWGFGVTQITRGGMRWYGHEGSIQGASAFIGWEPQQQLGVTIMVNNEGPAIALILNKLGEMLRAIKSTTSFQGDPEKPGFNAAHKSLNGTYLSLSPVSSKTELVSALPWKIIVRDDSAFIKPFAGKPRLLLPGADGALLHAGTGQKVLASGNDLLAGEVIYYGPHTLIKTHAIRAWLPLASIAFFVLSATAIFLCSLIWLPFWLVKRRSTFVLNKTQLLHRILPICNATLLVVLLILIKTGLQSVTPFKLLGEPGGYSVTLFLISILMPTLLLSHWLVFVKYRTDIKTARSGFLRKTSGAVAYLHLIFGLPFVLTMLSFGYFGIMTWL